MKKRIGGDSSRWMLIVQRLSFRLARLPAPQWRRLFVAGFVAALSCACRAIAVEPDRPPAGRVVRPDVVQCALCDRLVTAYSIPSLGSGYSRLIRTALRTATFRCKQNAWAATTCIAPRAGVARGWGCCHAAAGDARGSCRRVWR